MGRKRNPLAALDAISDEVASGDAEGVIDGDPGVIESASDPDVPPGPPEAEVAPAWPADVTVRNHTAWPLVEPVSGLFIQPGGCASRSIASADTAHAMVENLRAHARRHGGTRMVEIIGLPDEI